MARKPGARSRTARRATSGKADNRVIEVTVVLLEAGYASTAIGPLEVFHSAGLLWNWLHGETAQPRFRVRVASIDGRRVNSICSLGLTPECAIGDIKQTDIIILPASGWDVQGQIARNTSLLPWLRKWHARGAYVADSTDLRWWEADSGRQIGRVADGATVTAFCKVAH
jgi:transcriptional regulator GlxA family with amidase domain